MTGDEKISILFLTPTRNGYQGKDNLLQDKCDDVNDNFKDNEDIQIKSLIMVS